jgi:hypothetical protein
MDSCYLHLGKLNYNYRFGIPTERNTAFEAAITSGCIG